MGKIETFDISRNQLNILQQEQSAGGTAINNIASTVRFQGFADPVLLCETVRNVVRADASLRIALTEKNGRVVQYRADFAVPEIPVLDFSASDEAYYVKWAETRAKEPIYALDAPLFRFYVCILGENSLCLFVCTHHIISDGWSHMALCNRIAEAYLRAAAGNAEPIPETYDYADYIANEKAYLASEKYKEDKVFWEETLSAARDAVALKPVKGASVSNVGARKTFPLSVTLNNSVYAYCTEHGVSPFGVYFVALAACLRRGGCGDRITVGVPVFNRGNFRFRNTTGMFVSTLPYTCEADDTLSLNALCDVFLKNWTDTLRHQRFPFSEMLPMTGEDGRLFHLMLSFQNNSVPDVSGADCRVSGMWHYCGYQNEQLCIQMTDFEGKNAYSVNYDWQVQLFTEKEISDLHSHVCRILYAALEDPDRPLRRIVLADGTEQERVVHTFNAAAGDPAPFVPPYRLFRTAAAERPGAAAVIFRDCRVSYAELADMGQKVAAAVGGAGKLCAVLLPKCVWTYACMMGILQAGSAFCSICTDQPEERIRSILKSSGAEVLFTDEAHAPVFAVDVSACFDVRQLTGSTSDEADVRETDLAYTVYTSGTTGAPKGVEIGCGSLVNLCRAMQEYYTDGAVLSLCNTGFDAFVLESVAAMCCGKTVVLADDEEKDNPAAIASLMERYGVRFVALTPSRLQALLHSAPFRHAAAQLQTVICGGEQFPSALLRSLKKVTKAAVYNQYGPSEATVAVSMARLDAADRITAGKPMRGCRLYVLDDCMHPLPENFTGELYIGGVCVGKGYRNAPELTEKSFFPSPFHAGERLYKTGDAARWNARGEIEILGRRDAQVKLRGLRVEPQEIASCLAGFPGVKAAAAKAAEWNGQTVLFGYYAADTELPETDMLAFIASYLPRYMIPARILRIGAVPLTSNGKIDERRLPVPEENGEAVLPANRTQAKLLAIFRKTLNNDKIHAGSDYFLCGGNSLSAMETLAAIEEEFGVHMPISALNACRTVVMTEAYLRPRMTGKAKEENRLHAPTQDGNALSATQKSIFFESLLDRSGMAYLMPCVFTLPEDTDVDKLSAAFAQLVAEDPIFRTSFAQKDGTLTAVPAASVPFSFADFSDAGTARAWLLAPFDPGTAPLFRAGILTEDGKKKLLLCIHHIICDGLSVPVILERLDFLYRGLDIPGHLTFAEGKALAANAAAETLSQQKEYWKEKLSGCPAYTDIAPDFPRPAVFDGKGATETVHFGAGVKEAVKSLCRKYRITEYMLFAGAFGILFSRLSGEKTVVLGTPVSGRRAPGFDRIVGPLMRTVPLRLDAEGTLTDYFSAVRTSVTEMIDNADCSVTDIAELADLSHTRERNPLYQILFQMRPVRTEEFLLDGKTLQYSAVSTGIAKLDLNAEAFPEGDGYALQMEYAASVYLPETVRGWGASLEKILLTLAAEAGDKPLADLSFADTAAETGALSFPYCCLQEEIQKTTLQNANKTALIWHHTEYTFAEMETLACRFVRQLRNSGVEKGDRVGIVMQRSPQLFAGLLAILRCGAAYVPFLSSYPADRIQYMMRTAQVRCILCDAASRGSTVECDCPVILADETAEMDTVLTQSNPQDPIYILFTSGSTGRPKGVENSQIAISNLLSEEKKYMDGLRGPMLCSSNCTFDIFTTESILALAQGFTVILADDAEMLHPWMLADLISCYRPQLAQFTPSRLVMCLRNMQFREAVQYLFLTIVAGENVPPELVTDFRSLTGSRLLNMYGPTEAAVYVCAGYLSSGDNITVGKALGNCRLYILDDCLRPVLPGEKGELYIAGTCLSTGYISQPDLTAQLFVDDPFVPGEKMYRSGDIFRLRADGRYECFGRRDGQIKINGIRVETGEINQVLVRCGAERAVTVVIKNADGSSRLETAVSPETVEIDTLRKAAAELLPDFMMPAKIAAFPVLPYNASGKADLPHIRRMLDGAKENTVTVKITRAPTETEKTVLDVWEKVIGIPGLSPEESFFRQGGTSLTALNVIGEYYNRGLIMTMENFFAHPTAREQAELMLGRNPHTAVKQGTDLMSVPDVYPRCSREEKDILLTGATGFLGAHLLNELLRKKKGIVFCVTRDGSRERLNSVLQYYFGDIWKNEDRIVVLKGDISLPFLGLSEEILEMLAFRVSDVIHAAADVRHYATDDSLIRTNVEGTSHVAELALRCQAALSHISTASIGGTRVDSQDYGFRVYTEADFDIGQTRDNRYICGKMEAERSIYSYLEKGLDARIFRIGRLCGRKSDGVFQKNRDKNTLWRVTKAFQAVGCLSEELQNLPVELLPVDVCALEVVSLLRSPAPVYHLVQPAPLTLGKLVKKYSFPISVEKETVFRCRLLEVSRACPDITSSLIDFLNEGILSSNILLSSEKTRMYLKLTGIVPENDIGHALDEFRVLSR